MLPSHHETSFLPPDCWGSGPGGASSRVPEKLILSRTVMLEILRQAFCNSCDLPVANGTSVWKRNFRPQKLQNIETLIFFIHKNLIMSGDISKQIQSINKQLASVGPAVQVGNFLGVSPFAGVVAVGVGVIVALLLFLDVFTGFI